MILYTPARKFLICPKRQADFKHRHWDVWLDEGVAFSDLTGKKFKFTYFPNGDNPAHSNNNLFNTKWVQAAGWHDALVLRQIELEMKNHLHNKFEEIFLKVDI